MNNHRSSQPPQARAKVAQDEAKSNNVTVFTYERMSHTTKSRSVLKQSEHFPVPVSVSAPKQSDKLHSNKEFPLTQTEYDEMSHGKNPSDKQASFENHTAMETEEKEHVDNYCENIDVSAVKSIQRFRSLISGLAGGDGTGYPDIEGILARDPAREEEVVLAAREYWGSLAA